MNVIIIFLGINLYLKDVCVCIGFLDVVEDVSYKSFLWILCKLNVCYRDLGN